MYPSIQLFPLWVGLVACTMTRVHIQVPVTDIEKEDTYMCFTTPMKEYEGYSLVGYEIDSIKGVAHHASVLACEGVYSDQIYWDCTSHQGSISKGRAVGLHGKDGAEIEYVRRDFPEDVGIELGPKANINFMVLQVHYKHPFKVTPGDSPSTNLTLLLTDKRRKNTRQTLLMASAGYIPANTERFSSELILKWSGITVEAPTYTIHAHDHGIVHTEYYHSMHFCVARLSRVPCVQRPYRMRPEVASDAASVHTERDLIWSHNAYCGVIIEGYIIKNGVISLIGRQSPQHHGTSTYKMENGTNLSVSPGDIIAARCIFNNPLNEPIKFGTARSDEMCNFSLNFWYPTEAAMEYPRTILRFQYPQNVTWCQNDVYMSHSLCEMSKIMF